MSNVEEEMNDDIFLMEFFKVPVFKYFRIALIFLIISCFEKLLEIYFGKLEDIPSKKPIRFSFCENLLEHDSYFKIYFQYLDMRELAGNLIQKHLISTFSRLERTYFITSCNRNQSRISFSIFFSHHFFFRSVNKFNEL